MVEVNLEIKKEILKRDPSISEEIVDYMLKEMNNDTTELMGDLPPNCNKSASKDELRADKLSLDEINGLIDKMPDKTPLQK